MGKKLNTKYYIFLRELIICKIRQGCYIKYMQIKILGVQIDDLSEAEVLDIIKNNLASGRRTFIVTPNPEMLVLGERDAEFKNILNGADIKIPDGAGLKFGGWILGQKLKNRATGTDLMERICGLAAERGLGAYFLGAGDGVAEAAAKNLNTKFVQLKIVGVDSGGRMQSWDNEDVLRKINAAAPDILFAALGHGKQEKWIAENLSKMPGVKLAMGVGGAFDFFAGRVRRAPNMLRRAGLEWLWRLILEPWRWRRIMTAVVVFPLMCWKQSMKKNQNLFNS